jgi:endonuclease/exonuclease/phosphatase family metal-dependent hydrolase
VSPSLFLLVVFASVAACAPGTRAPRSPAPGAAHFIVATFNVYHPSWQDAPTAQAVESTGADAVFLQEITPNWERVLRSRYSEKYPHMLFKTDRNSRGLGVLSRFPVADRGLLRAPHDWHPAWLVEVTLPSGNISVLNVHLRAVSTGPRNRVSNYFATAADHEHEIRSFVSRSAAAPAIVLGDFNEYPEGAAVRWLERRGFRNILPLYHPGQPTWRGRSLVGQFAMPIDHILVDGRFEPLNAWVVREGNSDHLPVVAHLELRRSQ